MTGRAGSGKTACVVEIVESLKARGLPVLAFRLDRIPFHSISTTADLGRELHLEESPALVLAAAAEAAGCPGVLIVDQLDAVSTVSGRNSAAFDLVEQLLPDARGMRACAVIHTVIVCRAFDWQNASRLRQLMPPDSQARVEVAEFTVEEIRTTLTDAGFDPALFLPRQRELLRLPQNLALFLEAGFDVSLVPAFDTPKVLFDRYWDAKRRSVTDHQVTTSPEQWLAVIETLCDEMAFAQQLSVVKEKLDSFSPDYLKQMASEGVLTFDGRRYGFGHESFFDYCFARLFVNRPVSLVSFLKSPSSICSGAPRSDRCWPISATPIVSDTCGSSPVCSRTRGSARISRSLRSRFSPKSPIPPKMSGRSGRSGLHRRSRPSRREHRTRTSCRRSHGGSSSDRRHGSIHRPARCRRELVGLRQRSAHRCHDQVSQHPPSPLAGPRRVADHLLLSLYTGVAARYADEAVVALRDKPWRFECGFSGSPPANARFRELERKFGEPEGEPRTIAAQWVGSPIEEDAADKMTDDQWLRAIAKYRSEDQRRFFHNEIRGGALQLAQDLERRVNEEPERFAHLGLRFPVDANPVYLERTLAGLKGAAAASVLKLQVCRKAFRGVALALRPVHCRCPREYRGPTPERRHRDAALARNGTRRSRYGTEVASCFRQLKEEVLDTYGKLIEAFCDSKAFQENSFSVLHTLEESLGRLPGTTCLGRVDE